MIRVKMCSRGRLALLANDAGDPELGGLEDALLFEKLPCPRLQRPGLFPATRLLKDELLQAGRLRVAKGTQAEVGDDRPLVRGQRGLSCAVALDQAGIETKLQRADVDQILDDLEGLLLWEAVEQPHKGQLVRKAEAILRPAALADLHQVRSRQRGGALELLAREHRPV